MAKKPSNAMLLALSVWCLALSGCDDREKEQAQAEAEQARVSLAKTKAQLARAEREIADLTDALETVKQSRDKLAQQVSELSKDRGSVLAASEEAQQTLRSLSARTSEQDAGAAALQKQVADLASLVESQERTITEQEATINELLKTIELLEGTSEGPMNEGQGQKDGNDIG